VLGKAATIYNGLMATQTQSYGPEARGGASKTEVILSDEEINYPFIGMADILVSLSQTSYTKYVHEVKKEGMMLVDTDLVLHHANKCIEVPAAKIAIELGSVMVANMVMLGALSSLTGLVTLEALTSAVKSSVPPMYFDMNVAALKRGQEFVGAIEKD